MKIKIIFKPDRISDSQLMTHDSHRLQSPVSRLPLLLLFLLLTISLNAVTIDELQSNDNYIIGYGKAENYEKAHALALKSLINQISVNVESKFIIRETEENGEVTENVERIINTYSSTTLYNLPEILQESRDYYEVWVYITKEEMSEIFAERENKIMSYYESGAIAESKMKMGTALRNYYWALELLKTHPARNKILAPLKSEKQILLDQFLHNKISAILSGISFELSDSYIDMGKKYLIYDVRYNGEKAADLDYRYYTGSNGWSKYITVNNGLAYFELPEDFDENSITIQIEYRYEQSANFDREVRTVLEGISADYFKESQREVLFDQKEKIDFRERLYIEIKNAEGKIDNALDKEKSVLAGILEYMMYYSDYYINPHFTENGMNDFAKLIRYGKAHVLSNDLKLNSLSINGEKQIRGIPMKFSFPDCGKEFVEYVNFKFDDEQKISGITFSLSDKAVQDIMKQDSNLWKPEEKYKLIEFMEYYKTAYCLKDISFIENVFADNALIIVGRVLKAAEHDPENIRSTLPEDKVKYIRYQKDEYITHLKKVFASNEYVNIRFEESNIKRYSNAPDSSLYAIQIFQNYDSQNYGDKGYLFLMMDLENMEKPLINIRSWQRERFPDGTILGVNDFRIK